MQVELDFDVWKAVTTKRRDELDTLSAVLRRELGLPARSDRKPLKVLGCRGGTIPLGSELRATYHGKDYAAQVTGSGIRLGTETFSNPSSAASKIAGYPTNGWTWFECRTPGSDSWVLLDDVRKGR